MCTGAPPGKIPLLPVWRKERRAGRVLDAEEAASPGAKHAGWGGDGGRTDWAMGRGQDVGLASQGTRRTQTWGPGGWWCRPLRRGPSSG